MMNDNSIACPDPPLPLPQARSPSLLYSSALAPIISPDLRYTIKRAALLTVTQSACLIVSLSLALSPSSSRKSTSNKIDNNWQLASSCLLRSVMAETGNAPQIAKFELVSSLVSRLEQINFIFILFHFIPFHFTLCYLLFLLCWEIDSNFLCTFRISYDYATIIINVNFLWPFPLTVATLFFMWRSWSNRGGYFLE